MVVTLQPSYVLSKEEVPKGIMPVDFVPPLKKLIGSLIQNPVFISHWLEPCHMTNSIGKGGQEM